MIACRAFVYATVTVAGLFCLLPKADALAVDRDGDGLSDRLEQAFRTAVDDIDSDNDGYPDGVEVAHGYDPNDPRPKKLPKQIVIALKSQRLRYFLGNVELGAMRVSTGTKWFPTPKGEFLIVNKALRAWSKPAQLWMPFWMGMKNGKFGIHELPEWPNGRKEGASSLGRPASHGCIRLGVGDAKKLFDWTPVGTRVVIE